MKIIGYSDDSAIAELRPSLAPLTKAIKISPILKNPSIEHAHELDTADDVDGS